MSGAKHHADGSSLLMLAMQKVIAQKILKLVSPRLPSHLVNWLFFAYGQSIQEGMASDTSLRLLRYFVAEGFCLTSASLDTSLVTSQALKTILAGLSTSIASLSLEGVGSQVVPRMKFPWMANLTTLRMDITQEAEGTHLIMSMLPCCPQLQTLSISLSGCRQKSSSTTSIRVCSPVSFPFSLESIVMDLKSTSVDTISWSVGLLQSVLGCSSHSLVKCTVRSSNDTAEWLWNQLVCKDSALKLARLTALVISSARKFPVIDDRVLKRLRMCCPLLIALEISVVNGMPEVASVVREWPLLSRINEQQWRYSKGDIDLPPDLRHLVTSAAT
jgi:hypothetical protein